MSIIGEYLMARLDKERFEEKSKEHNNVQDVVGADYKFFELEGKKYFQIDSYGKRSRKNPGKVSQSIQFDEEFARELVRLLREEFQI